MLADLDQRALAAIYRHGGGNPFYLEQLARASEPGPAARALRAPGAGDEAAGACRPR